MLKILIYILLAFAILFLSAGWTLLGYWPVGLFLLLLIPVSLVLLKLKFSPICSLVLTLSVLLSALGLWRGLDISLALAGVLSALAAWDLIFLDADLGANSSGEQTRRYENKHLQSLVLAVGCGLIVTIIGRLLNLQTPFVLLILFVALFVFGLERIWDTIKKRNIH